MMMNKKEVAQRKKRKELDLDRREGNFHFLKRIVIHHRTASSYLRIGSSTKNLAFNVLLLIFVMRGRLVEIIQIFAYKHGSWQ